MKKINIAVDGYSSCGKSTMAKELARRLGYKYIDSGAMYRAVTLYGMRIGSVTPDKIDSNALIDSLDKINIEFKVDTPAHESYTCLAGENVEFAIRTMAVSQLVSKVSIIPAIRKKLVALQKGYGKDGGVVMDGRDIGTVVFPNAELKIFMTAGEEIRSERRYAEMRKNNSKITLQEVRENIMERDHHDTTREQNPLRKADDAVVIDNTNLSMKQQNDLAYSLAIKRINESLTL